MATAASPAFDDFTFWTGCVIRDENGIWHLFYTRTSRGEDGKIQRIGHATGRDLSNWDRHGVALERAGTNAEHYAGFLPARWKDCSLRDPWVMRDPEGDGWLMYFTARSPNRGDQAHFEGTICDPIPLEAARRAGCGCERRPYSRRALLRDLLYLPSC
jgi:hypothetical protein